MSLTGLKVTELDGCKMGTELDGSKRHRLERSKGTWSVGVKVTT